ncbi:MAG TPA: hypothetical protein VMH78_04765, partial [Thermoplasmata archaeon]|nr:hypothetical protein [Thermoplasmata archaeon]
MLRLSSLRFRLARGRRASALSLGLLVALGLLTIGFTVGRLADGTTPVSLAPGAMPGGVTATAQPAAASPAATTSTTTVLSLGATADPATICALDGNACSAGVGQTRVTLSAQVTSTAKPAWSDVQVAFVMETTGPDGDEDHYNAFYGTDPCAAASSGQGPLC